MQMSTELKKTKIKTIKIGSKCCEVKDLIKKNSELVILLESILFKE